MDVRQRTFLLAIAGLGLGVFVIIGVLVLTMRTRSERAAPSVAEHAREKTEAKASPTSDEGVGPPAQEAAPGRRDGVVAQPLVVYDGAVRRVSCGTACFIEEQCGFRAADVCRAASCEGAFRKVSHSDFQLGQGNDCGVLALVPCEEACWRRGECAGDHQGDKQCTSACVTLGRQLPRETFRESRCVLESACGDLPLCGGVLVPRVPVALPVDAGPATTRTPDAVPADGG